MDMKPIWGAVAFGTLLTAALPALADVKAGVDAWQQGDYAKAITEWRPLANAGDPDAQFNLGQAYKLGRGVPADLSSAVDWYRKATAQGHARAEDNLGLLMFQQGDRAGAMPYLQHAAARGETRAQYIVGTALFNGDMVGKDWVRAYAMMTRASASGLPQATTSLQQMDKYIPADQRKQGLALASSMEAQEKSLASASLTLPATAAQPRPASPAPAPAKPAPAPMTQVAVAKPQPVAPKPAPEAAKPAPSKPTPPKPAPSRMPAPAAGGDWRVQL
ncbi:MAG: tetratricopeptide repeat protein, partial [Sphingobium yanoikuyae]